MAFIDQGEFEAMKTLSGWEAAHSDEHQLYRCLTSGLNKERIRKNTKMALLLSHTFVFSCLPRGFWPLI